MLGMLMGCFVLSADGVRENATDFVNGALRGCSWEWALMILSASPAIQASR